MNNEYLNIIAKYTKEKIPASDLRGEHLLVEDLGFDSIIFVAMIVDLEDTYNISFDDEYISMTALRTVQDIADYIQTKSEK